MMTEALAIIGIFFVPIIMIILIAWFKSSERRKRNELQADLYAKALEKGQSIPDIPADLFAELKEPKKKNNPLNTGVICIATGIGISVFIWLGSISFAQVSEEASAVFISFASVGIIPFLIGLAFVIIHFIEKKKDTEEDAK